MRYFLPSLCVLILFACQTTGNTEEQPKERLIKSTITSTDSSIINRTYQVYLPSSYYENEQKTYPVLYLMDGAVQFGGKSAFSGVSWDTHNTMDSLVKAGKVKEMILVGIDNAMEKRFAEYMPQKPAEAFLKSNPDTNLSRMEYPLYADQFLAFLTKELKAKIDQDYRTRSGNKDTYIGGSSMGGLISMYALCEYPDVFAGALCLSTHWIVGYDDSLTALSDELITYFADEVPSNKIWYFDYGTEGLDQYYEKQQLRIDSVMQTKQYPTTNWMTKKFEGHDHNESYWNQRLHIPLEFAFAK